MNAQNAQPRMRLCRLPASVLAIPRDQLASGVMAEPVNDPPEMPLSQVAYILDFSVGPIFSTPLNSKL